MIKPRYENVKAAKVQIAAQQENLATASKLKQSREDLITTYNSISEDDLTSLKTLLPDSVDNIRLIIQIDSLGAKNGLTTLKNVEYVVDKDIKVDTSAEVANAPYGEFTISFQTSGQYKNFLRFISDLEQNLRLVDVTDITFLSNESATTQSASTMLNYKVTLKTYWLKK